MSQPQFVSLDQMAEMMRDQEISPGVFCFPRDLDAFRRLQRYSRAVGLGAPVRWTHCDLHLPVRSLISAPLAEAGAGEAELDARQVALGARIAGLPGSVVVLCAQPSEGVRALMGAYKEERQEWPLFAVLTPMAIDMSVGMYFDHLVEDRLREMAKIRARAAAAADTKNPDLNG